MIHEYDHSACHQHNSTKSVFTLKLPHSVICKLVATLHPCRALQPWGALSDCWLRNMHDESSSVTKKAGAIHVTHQDDS
jgi:hypothetical protein